MMVNPLPSRGFLPFDNPVSQWADPRRNALMGFSAGMLAGNPGAAMTGAMQGAGIDRQFALDAQERERFDTERNQTMDWLKANYPQYTALPVDQAWQLAMADESARRAQAGPGSNLMSVGGHLYDKNTGQWISPPETAENRQNISLTPQWGTGPDGNPAILQTSSTGEMVPATVPEGYVLSSPFDVNADRAAGNVYGRGVGGAQFDLPGAQLIANQTIAAINDVRAQEQGMNEHFGSFAGIIPQQMTPAWPGSPKATFQVAADRAINRAFLEGREMLKGGGQITDFESRKAEAAITAAQSALEKGDKAQFLKALDDFEQAVRDGVAKLASQGAVMPGYGAGRAPQPSGTGASGTGWTVLGVE